MEGVDRMQVPHKASATRGAVPRSSPFATSDAVDRKAPITCGLPRIPKPTLEIPAEGNSPPGVVAAKPSVSHTPAAAKQRARRSDGSLLKLNENNEAVNSKKQRRNGILPLERSAFPAEGAVINWNYSEGLTIGSEIRDNNANPNKQSCLSVAEPQVECQGNSPPKKTLEVGKCRDTIKDSEGSGPIVDERQRLPSERERSKKKIPRKCNDGTTLSVATAVNGEIKPVELQKVDSESVTECRNARASRENIHEDAPKAGRCPASEVKSSRAPRRGSGMGASPADRFFRLSGTFGAQECHNLHEKSHVVGVANNRVPSTLFFPQMIQWVGVGRRQKISRTRRKNITFPVSASSPVQQLGGCHHSQHEREVSAKAGRPQCTKDGAVGIPHLKVKLNGRPLPTRLPEYGARPSNEIRSIGMRPGGVESNKRYMKMVQLSNPIPVATKDMTFEGGEVSDGKQREERSSQISRLATSDDSSSRERMDKSEPKPVGAVNKNESNTGSGCPPVGKSSDQMTSTCQENSLLYVGRVDDWIELFEVPNLASKPSCLTSFSDLWKDMESLEMRNKDMFCPKEQGELTDGRSPELKAQVCEEREPVLIGQSATAKPATPGCQVHRAEDMNANKSFRKLDTGEIEFGPLFERVLSAFIYEDGRTFKGNDEEIPSFLHIRESMCYGDKVSPCDDNNGRNIQSGISNDVLPKGAPCSMQKGFLSEELSTSGSACSDERYQRMSIDIRLLLELQSLGIYLEALPDLIDEENEAVIRNILGVRERVAEQASNSEARAAKLSGTISKGTSADYKDLEGAATEEVADPSYIKQPVRRKRTASMISKPEVPEDAAPVFRERTLDRSNQSTLCTTPVCTASGATSSQGKQPVLQTAEAPLTQDSEKGDGISSLTNGALSDDHGGIRAEVFVNNTSKSVVKGVTSGESNIETTRKQQAAQVSAASEAATTDMNDKGEIDTANSGRNEEESAGPSIDMLGDKDLSTWLDTGNEDVSLDGDLIGLHTPKDDLSEVGLFL